MTAIKPAKHFVRCFLKLTKFDAVTLPPFGIYIREEKLNDVPLRQHEIVHWNQYLQMGVIKFYALYFWYTLRYGYWNNPMEVEARAAMQVTSK